MDRQEKTADGREPDEHRPADVPDPTGAAPAGSDAATADAAAAPIDGDRDPLPAEAPATEASSPGAAGGDGEDARAGAETGAAAADPSARTGETDEGGGEDGSPRPARADESAAEGGDHAVSDQAAEGEPAATEPEAGAAGAQEGEPAGDEAPEPAPPDQDISRLDTLLARITGKAAATATPSNDNLDTGLAGGRQQPDHPSAAASTGPAGSGEAAQSAPEEAEAGESEGADGATARTGGRDNGAEPRAEADPDPPAAGESAPADGRDGQRASGDGDEPAGHHPGDDQIWPDGWGSPSGQNVLRVLSELMTRLDAQQPAAGGAAGRDELSRDDDEPAAGASAAQQEAAPARTGPGDGGAPGTAAREAPAEPPPRPVLTGPPPRRGNAYWRPVREGAAGSAHAGAAPAQPARTAAAAPPATDGSGTPAALHRRDLAPWMLEQPEFQRAFGARPGVDAVAAEAGAPTTPGAILPQAEMRQGGGAPGWRRAGTLATAAAVVAVFAIAGYSGYRLYDMRNEGAATGAVTDLRTPAAERGAVPAAQSLLPQPVLPPGSGDTRIVRPVATGPAGALPDQFSTFSGAGRADGPGPTITIERTAVRPFAEGSPGALAVSRLDGLNVTVAKLIAALEVDKAEEIVGDILARDRAHFGALLNRGRIHLLRDRFADAGDDFARAREIKPQSLAAALGESEALLGQRRGAEALKIIEAAIAANPGEAAAYDLRARAHAMTGQSDLIAVDCAELSWKTGLAFAGKWCEAMAYKDAGRTRDSEAAFRAALDGGSEDFVRHRQRYLKFRGHYSGEIDGEVGPATNLALAGCAADPNC